MPRAKQQQNPAANKGKGEAKAKPKRRKVKVYSAGKSKPDDKAKLAPQARTIVQVVHENQPIDKKTLVDRLNKSVKTKQPVDRILAYYQNRLIADDFIKVATEEREVA